MSEEKKELELHLEERPGSFKAVVGQSKAVAQLVALASTAAGIPHCLLFSGPSGCGKTTLARIVKKRLGCADPDFFEVNAANNRGIEMVRDIQQRVGLAPIAGESRVWLIDEAHQLTAEAQSAFLKLLEEPPRHVWFMLATTHPDKLKDAIRTRCTDVKVNAVQPKELKELVQRVASARDFNPPQEVLDKVVEMADGSPRKALVLLQQILGMVGTEQMLAALENGDAKVAAIEIARAIIGRKGFKVVADLVRGCNEDPEGIRRLVLAYFNSVALGGGKNAGAAIAVMKCFQFDYFASGKAGLTISCYEACGE